MNRFASKFAASSLVIAAAMVGCHSDSMVSSASASTEQRAHQQAARFAEQARAALQQGDAARALGFAERAVEASPRDSGYRMLLADLYLKNGRFSSAEATYDDVLSIDSGNVRAGLSIALAQIAQGRSGDALVQLEQMRDTGPASDVGLAYALAGQPQRAIELLEPAARRGANGRTARIWRRLRPAGDWQRARTVAAQDARRELGRRLQHWASLAQPSGQQSAVATLLGVTPAADPGQPVRLALALPQDVAEAYAEAGTEAEAAPAAEAPAEAPVQFAEAPAPEPVAEPVQEPIQYAEAPVVTAPAPVYAAAPAPAAAATAPAQSASWWPAPSASADVPRLSLSSGCRRSACPRRAGARRAGRPVRYAAAMRSLSAPSPVVRRSPATVARTAARLPSGADRARRRGLGPHPARRRRRRRFVVQLGAFANTQNAERAWAQASSRFGFGARKARTARVTVNGRAVTRVSVAGFATAPTRTRLLVDPGARRQLLRRAAAGDAPVRWASQRPATAASEPYGTSRKGGRLRAGAFFLERFPQQIEQGQLARRIFARASSARTACPVDFRIARKPSAARGHSRVNWLLTIRPVEIASARTPRPICRLPDPAERQQLAAARLPVLSNSRRAAASGVSPGSISPLGIAQAPASCSAKRAAEMDEEQLDPGSPAGGTRGSRRSPAP